MFVEKRTALMEMGLQRFFHWLDFMHCSKVGIALCQPTAVHEVLLITCKGAWLKLLRL